VVALLLALVGCDAGVTPEPRTDGVPSDPVGEDTAPAETGHEGETGASDHTGDTAPPPDADGDGYGDASCGGDDCDDADPSVHPGAEDWCDGVDRDCDGTPYSAGACGKAQDLSVIADGTWDGDTGFEFQNEGRFVGDLDGDGSDDVVLHGASPTTDPEWRSDSVSDFLYVPGGQPLDVGTPRQDAATASWHSDLWSTPLQAAYAAGDVNGDGNPDLWLLSNDEYGAAALLLGPPSRWGHDQNFLSAADVVWFGEAYRDGFANPNAAANIDFDQDGFADAAFFSQQVGEDEAVYLIRGRADVADEPYRYGMDETKIPCDNVYDVAGGDITGDGVADLVLGRGSIATVTILDGLDLAAADGVDCGDLPGVAVTGDRISSLFGVTVVGDWDGDGLDDWVAESSHDSNVEYWDGSLYLFSGASGGAAGDLAYAQMIGTGERAALGSAYPRAMADLTGDALPEIGTAMLMDSESGTEDVAVVIPSGSYSGLALPVPENTLLFRGSEADERVATAAPSAGDFDGDGVNDILTGGGYWGAQRGREYLILGGDIPWDNPSAW
jgi:hypothetical protein